MSSNAAGTNGATQTAIEAVVRTFIAFEILGRTVKASAVAVAEKAFANGRVRPAGINFRAKKRIVVGNKDPEALLKGLVGKVKYNGEALRLGEKYLTESGAIVVGAEPDKLDKNGKFKSKGRPQIVFVANDTIDGIEYQALVKCRVGGSGDGRYIEFAIDTTRANAFSEMGEFEGDWDDIGDELVG